MKISEHIAKLQKFLETEGDLEMFDGDGYAIRDIRVSGIIEESWPGDWAMPEKFIVVRNDA